MQKQKLVAEAAQEEAKQRARKLKSGAVIPLAQEISKCYKFTLVEEDANESLDDETPPPFIAVKISKERLPTYAFIDSRVDGNTISYKLFQKLKNVNLKETNAMFKYFTGHTTKAQGVCEMLLHVSELICGDKFFVTQVGMQDVPLILGRTWQHKHNCFFNWEKRLVHCQSADDNRLWVPLKEPNEAYAVAVKEIVTTQESSQVEPIPMKKTLKQGDA